MKHYLVLPILLLSMLSVGITGCTSLPAGLAIGDEDGIAVSPVSGQPLEKEKKSIYIDHRLLAECQPLNGQLAGNPTPSDVLDAKTRESEIYYDCASRQQELSDLVRKIFNIVN